MKNSIRIETELEVMRPSELKDKNDEKKKRDANTLNTKHAIFANIGGAGNFLESKLSANHNALRKDFLDEKIISLEKEQLILQRKSEDFRSKILKKFGTFLYRRKDVDINEFAREFFSKKMKSNVKERVDLTNELTISEEESLRFIFQKLDVKEKGFLTIEQAMLALRILGIKTSQHTLCELNENLNIGKKGKINFVDFLLIITYVYKDGDDPMEDILNAFSYLDVDRKGYLTINDLRHAADNNGLKFSTSDLGDMMLEADTSGTSTVTQQEFINILLMTITTKYYRM